MQRAYVELGRRIAEKIKDDVAEKVAELIDIDELAEMVQDELNLDLIAEEIATEMKPGIVSILVDVVGDEVGGMIDETDICELIV